MYSSQLYTNYRLLIRTTLLIMILCCPTGVRADGPPDEAEASPKSPWGHFEVVEEKEPHWIQHVLMWFPNRFLDLVDVFRADVGAGLSHGGVIRITKYGQAGYRKMSPASARLGLMGRRAPALLEESDEKGIGPNFTQSKQRVICPGEIGAGLDLLIVGAYAGVCVDEAVDFIGGIFFIDILDDDLKVH